MKAGRKLGVDLFGLDLKLMPLSIDKLGSGDSTLNKAVLELLVEGQKNLGIEKIYSIDDATLFRGYNLQG